ncbi:MAG: hypothetical protein ABI467_06830 [Kofleriaceae bacterium]
MTKTIFVSFILFSSLVHAQPTDDHAKFSGKRLAVEILGGEVVGALVTGLTFNALCNGEDCLGSAFTAFGVNVAVTPLAVWGIGAAMGGEGSLGYSYLGASLALTPFSVTGSPDESPSDAVTRVAIEAWVSSILLAPCSALMYEATSHVSWTREHQMNLALRTLHDREGLDGAVGMISGRW